MSLGMCKLAARHPIRRRKHLAIIATLSTLCALAWLRLAELDSDAGFFPLRTLGNPELEARRLLALMTHYNYQCNVTAGQIGNWSLWPLCTSRDAGFSIDNKETKLLYTIGLPPDFAMERSLAANHSFEVYVATRHSLPPSLRQMNNTHVIPVTVVPNDPADFSRNSYVQRTVNDVLSSTGHSTTRVDLLRLVSVDSDAVSMADIVRYLVTDNALRHVQQLHLTVYIDKLDEDYVYNWYWTLYQLHSAAGFQLYHTSSHDLLCLQVTLMQSCVYFLSYVRDPGTHVFTMQPPADFGTTDQEWSRLQDYVTSPQVNCWHSSTLKLANTAANAVDLLQLACTEDRSSDVIAAGSCIDVLFSSSSLSRRRHRQHLSSLSAGGDCAVLQLSSVGVHSRADEPTTALFKLAALTPAINRNSGSRDVSREITLDQLRDLGQLRSIVIDSPRLEFDILNQLLSAQLLQNATQLVIYVEFPDITASRVHPVVLRSAYSTLRRVEFSRLRLFRSEPAVACRASPGQPMSAQEMSQQTQTLRCYWLGFTRTKSLY